MLNSGPLLSKGANTLLTKHPGIQENCCAFAPFRSFKEEYCIAAGIVTMETSLVVLDDNVWDKSFS